MAAFYSATAQMVSWLGSLSHASEWVAGQNLADPNTWNSSALHNLKQLHDNLLTHYNCTEWAPPLADDAPASDDPAQGSDNDSARPLSLPLLNLLASLRARQDEDNGEVAARPLLPPQRQVTKHIMQTWTCMSRSYEIRLRIACVMYTCFITPHWCPCLMRPLPCMAICRNATTRRAASNHVSFSPLQRQCGARCVGPDGPHMDDRRPKCATHHRFYHGEGLCCLLPSILQAHQQPCPRSFCERAMPLPAVLHGW
jgi:hypothetical protein